MDRQIERQLERKIYGKIVRQKDRRIAINLKFMFVKILEEKELNNIKQIDRWIDRKIDIKIDRKIDRKMEG